MGKMLYAFSDRMARDVELTLFRLVQESLRMIDVGDEVFSRLEGASALTKIPIPQIVRTLVIQTGAALVPIMRLFRPHHRPILLLVTRTSATMCAANRFWRTEQWLIDSSVCCRLCVRGTPSTLGR